MNPTEKAQDLQNKFGKELASKVVDEIQNTKSIYVNDIEYDYWEQVKHELTKQQEQ
jgi:hypothetical protein